MSLAILMSSFSVSGTNPQLSLQASLKTSMMIFTSSSRFFGFAQRDVISGIAAISSCAFCARGGTSPTSYFHA